MGFLSLFKKKKANNNKALEKANKYRLGMEKTRTGLLNKLKGLFNSYDEITELKTLLEKRNYFAHEYFKYTNFSDADEGFILEEFEAIKEIIQKLRKFLSRIDTIISGQKERIDYLVRKNDL